MSPRKPNLESSIYLGSDGWWHGRVTMGVKDDGSPDRRHRRARTEPEIKRKVKALEALRDKGRVTKAGRKPTVAGWMETYLTDIASLKLKPRSLDDYWSKTRNDIIPGVGAHRIDKLQPEHLEKMYRAMLDAGHAPSHVLKVHRILSRALKIAHRRRIIGENVATLVDPPSVDETEANPFTQEQAKAFLVAAAKRPTFMRWIVGVGMGFRQGETLGLRWSYVDLDNELFHPRWQLQRLTWRHGCTDPHACGGTPPPVRPVPARLRHPQGLHARLPQALRQDVRPPREHLPAEERRRTGLHPSEDEEESEPCPYPAAVRGTAARAQGPPGGSQGRGRRCLAGVRRGVHTAGRTSARSSCGLGRVQGSSRRSGHQRPPPVRRQPPHRRHDPQRTRGRPGDHHGDPSPHPGQPDPPLRQGPIDPLQGRHATHGRHVLPRSRAHRRTRD